MRAILFSVMNAVHYAARTASELGADVVKVNFPHPEKRTDVPEPCLAEFSAQLAAPLRLTPEVTIRTSRRLNQRSSAGRSARGGKPWPRIGSIP
jgi:class I fructose-bisphosphate aldolase